MTTDYQPHVISRRQTVYQAQGDSYSHVEEADAYRSRAVTLMTACGKRKFRNYWNDTAYWFLVRDRLARFLAFVDRQPETPIERRPVEEIAVVVVKNLLGGPISIARNSRSVRMVADALRAERGEE